ncbi:hypothetical protein C8F04DRAFT_962458 [Mycena alexandri]|uniref:Uncharacterized protein n=1 Tax=Mycena alexandri TaxID=1745969 RepID=A0AAD6SKT8_9AGAR|nr:hypothetical protein C8F04DRAFT_962458 [Mycena alexandri]
MESVPPLFVVSLDKDGIIYSRAVSFDMGGEMSVLRLRGVIYSGWGHFTARYISLNGVVWYHDGILTGRSCVEEGNLDTLSTDFLVSARGRRAINLIYAKG